MEVRRLDASDADLAHQAITTLKITDATVRERLDADYLRRFLDRTENILIVVLADGQPVGYLIAYQLDRIDRDQTMICFYEIAVAETHRRQGVGTALIERLKTLCRELNVMKMWVQTNRSNVAAVWLYESAGGVANTSGDEVTFEWRIADQ